jgi:hypothetical protein
MSAPVQPGTLLWLPRTCVHLCSRHSLRGLLRLNMSVDCVQFIQALPMTVIEGLAVMNYGKGNLS